MQRITLADDAILDGNGNPVFADQNDPLQDTIITPAFMNSVQEELAHLVESSGQTLIDGNYYQVTKAIRNADAILSNLTLTVNGSAPYPKLVDAFNALRGRFIGSGVIVTIQLAPMTHTQNQPLFITHPQGEHIVIKGNDADPTTTVLSVTPDLWTREQAAITVEAGGRLGGMSGFQIVHAAGGTYPAFPVFGLKASTGGRMKLGNVQVLNWSGGGIYATSGGVIIADGTFSNNAIYQGGWSGPLDATIFGNNWLARDTGFIYVKNATTNLAYRSGFVAETNGVIRMENCNAIGTNIQSRSGGTIYAYTCVSKGNGGGTPGFWATMGGNMVLELCTAGASGSVNQDGFKAESSSKIFAESCTAAYNTRNGFMAMTGSQITGGFNGSSNNGSYGYFLGNFSYIQSVTSGAGNTTALTNVTGANTTLMSMVG